MKNQKTLTVCSYCRKTLINNVWVYFYSKMIRIESSTTHGICPSCMAKALKELNEMVIVK